MNPSKSNFFLPRLCLPTHAYPHANWLPHVIHVSIYLLNVLMFPYLMTYVSILDVSSWTAIAVVGSHIAATRSSRPSALPPADGFPSVLRRHAAPHPMTALDAAASDADGPRTSLHIAPSPERHYQEPSAEVAAPCVLTTAPPSTRLPLTPTGLEA